MDPIPELSGDGTFPVPIAGESRYQHALEKLCGAPDEDGYDLTGVAELVLEDRNPYDSRAVRVDINGDVVGHLSREDARRFRASLGARGIASATRIRCPARIRGGWDRGEGDRGLFGVRLDLDLDPPRQGL